LKQAINANSPPAQPSPLIEPNWSLSPEPIALMMAYVKRENVSIKEAALKILPKWLTDNPSHSQAENARHFLKATHGNFGIAVKDRS